MGISLRPGRCNKKAIYPTWGNAIEVAPNLSFDGTIATDYFLTRSLGHWWAMVSDD
jgi:hypothetical protein